ncbi:hypothetical protein FQN54_002527 [Arachnomyces sp. PD_36]|nr:hypothetical protein FQN54_002527 [Arachnomyces sp. PD_36]
MSLSGTRATTRAVRWATSGTYPLSEALWKASGQKLRRDQSRVDIISPSLCDDVLKRLAPSLQNRPPCDIIDIFPGVGLFSSKLHDLVKPRRHILIEPSTKIYLPFLQPLLDRPSSAYHHLKWNPLELDTYDKLFEEGHLPEQGAGKSKGEHERYATNDTLLVLANLTYQRSLTPLKSKTPVAFIISQYLKATFSQSLFHRYGAVRIIATLPSDDSDVILPRLVNDRKKTSVLTEASALSLHQVAGVQTGWMTSKEWDMLETSAEEAAKKAQGKEIQLPEGREPEKILSAPFPKKHSKGDPPGVLRTKYDWHDELTELEAAFDRGEIDTKKIKPLKKKKGVANTDANPSEKEAAALKRRKRFMTLRYRISQENREFYAAFQLVDLQEQIDDLEQTIAIELVRNTEADKASIESQRAELVRLKSDLQTCLASSSHESLRRALAFMDDRRGYRNGGKDPLLLWERRKYEPMRIHPDEVYPRNPCSILDFQPDPNAPILASTTPDEMHDVNDFADEYPPTYRIFLHLLNHVSSSNTKSVPELLDTMFSGRPIEEIVRAVPSLLQVARATIPSNHSEDTIPSPQTTPSTNTGTNPEPRALQRSPIIKPPPEIETRNPEDPSSYDLSQARLRTVPPIVFWDLAVEWGRWPFRPESEREVINILGGKAAPSDI